MSQVMEKLMEKDKRLKRYKVGLITNQATEE